MDFLDIFLKVLLDNNLLGAVFSTIFIILVGYYLRRKELVPDSTSKILSSILLKVTLPALALMGFMKDISDKTFSIGLSVFGFGFIAYIILIILSFVLFMGYKGDKKDTLRTLMIFGSTTFFGLPIINAVIPDGILYANLFNIAYRVFLYSYGLAVMSGAKLESKSIKTILVNPIVIATFIGFFIWIFQKSTPTILVGAKAVPFTRIDLSIPWVFKGIKYLGSLSSPLAWLAIGMKLANISIKEAVTDKNVWYYSFIKLLVIPMLFIVIIIGFNFIGASIGFNLNFNAIMPVIIMLATPPATVAVAYAISFDKEAILASNASLLATVVSVAAIIFWIIVLSVLHTGGIF